MVIEEHDFKLTLCGECSNLWDLELLKTIKPKGGEIRQEFKNVGYGIPFESCIKRIMNYRLSEQRDSYDLKSYLEEYKSQLAKIKNLI